MKELILKIVSLLHLLLVLFVVITPFTDSNYFIILHIILIPFIILHWVCNDNTCMLTIIERKLRKEIEGKYDENDCITCRLIEPVYDFKNDYKSFSTLIYFLTILLWSISAGKMFCKYRFGLIRSYRDLFTI